MAAGRGVPLALLAVLTLQGAGALRVANVMLQSEFYQRDEGLQQEGGQFMFDFNGDEMFHVDLQKEETVWRLPEFGTFTSFEAQRALQNLAHDKHNLDTLMAKANRSQGAVASPEVRVFPTQRAELEEPNVLICFVDKFWPAVISVTWLRNGREVTDGIFESVFYRGQDHTFRKFSYLPFVPARGDYYDCRVEHEGLRTALLRHWEPQAPPPVSESTETLVCALGLAVGIVGIVAGTVLIIKAMRMSGARSPRDPL